MGDEMSNPEKRNYEKDVHVFLAFLRKKYNPDKKPRTLRRVVKFDEDLNILRRECESIGGYWRIHRTVNKRSTEKAFKLLLHYLLEHPECAPYVDSQWKTILLQPECRAERRFMLDVDFKDPTKIQEILKFLEAQDKFIIESKETPNGFHCITDPFNRELFKFDNVTVLTDGYIFIEEVKG